MITEMLSRLTLQNQLSEQQIQSMYEDLLLTTISFESPGQSFVQLLQEFLRDPFLRFSFNFKFL